MDETKPEGYIRRGSVPTTTAIHGRIKQHQRGPGWLPAKVLAEGYRIVRRSLSEVPVQDIYDGIQEHPKLPFPRPELPAAYYLAKKNGHPIVLTGKKTEFDFTDERLHLRCRNEEGVLILPCRNNECKEPIPVIIKGWTEHEAFKPMGCAVFCCWRCLLIVEYRTQQFRHGRLR